MNIIEEYVILAKQRIELETPNVRLAQSSLVFPVDKSQSSEEDSEELKAIKAQMSATYGRFLETIDAYTVEEINGLCVMLANKVQDLSEKTQDLTAKKREASRKSDSAFDRGDREAQMRYDDMYDRCTRELADIRYTLPVYKYFANSVQIKLEERKDYAKKKSSL